MENRRRQFLKQITTCCLLIGHPMKISQMINTKGIIIRTSPFDVKETIDRLVIFLEKKGATIYSRINQQNEVKHTGREMPPMEFLLFGNPAVGGAIMAANALAALDLPLKIIAWQDEDKTVKIAFNDAAYLQDRYTLSAKLVAPLNLEPLIEQALS